LKKVILMNKIEALLGVLIMLFSFFAILAIVTGVGTSAIMPGRYAWQGATRAYYFMAFLPFLGLAAIAHGTRSSKTFESTLGLVTLLWSFFSWWWIPLNIYDGASFFKTGLMEELVLTSWPLIVSIFLGIALTLDVMRPRLLLQVNKRNKLQAPTMDASSRSLTKISNKTHLRSILLIIFIATGIFTVPAIHTAKADSITFTESGTHHKPRIRWFSDLGYQRDPFAGGYLSTTPHEQASYGIYWQVERTRVTVSFPDTPDTSVIGAGNWLAVGMFVQVQDEQNNWNTVATIIPRIYWATEIVDMSNCLPDAKGNVKVRLYFTAHHKIDFVGLDTSPQSTMQVQEGQLLSAVHSVQGDVTDKLLFSDAVYSELVPSQSIWLTFSIHNKLWKKEAT
jgi:hypothetical protein